MKAGLNDLILEKQMGMQKKAIEKIRATLKGEKPFNMEKVDPKVAIDALNNLGYMDMDALVNEFGADNMNQFIYEVKMSEARHAK